MAKENRELFPIGEVAKMFRVSVGTLRHYEKIASWRRNLWRRIQDTGITAPGSWSA